MALITWHDRYATGIPQIDEDHRRIIALINRMDDELVFQQVRTVSGPALEELARYTEEHFAREEELMASYDFPGLDAHRLEHHRARTLLLGLRNQHLEGGLVRANAALTFLSSWLTEHILGTDLAYVEHLRAAGHFDR